MESFNLKQYIIQHIKDNDPKELTTQNINKYIRAAKAFQAGVETNEVQLDDEMKKFITSLDLLTEGDITKIIERLKGYFRLSGNGDILRVGPNNKFVRFDRPENARGYQSMFRRTGSSLQVNVEKLQEELSGGVMTENLTAFYNALVKVLPISINIKPDRRMLFLAKFIGVAAKTLTEREVPITEEGGDANISQFMVAWPRIKTRIRNAIPLGRIPRRRVLQNLYEILNSYEFDIETFTDIFMEKEFVENELDVPVMRDDPNGKTYAEWIVLAILTRHTPRFFSTRERKVVNSLGIDMEFDATTGKKPKKISSGERITELAAPAFNGRRFIFTNPNGDDIIYYTTGDITSEQVGRGLPNSYKLDREETIDDVVEFQNLQRADKKRHERAKQRFEDKYISPPPEINLDEFYSSLETVAEQLRRKEPRGEMLRDRDREGRAVSPSRQKFAPSKFYFHPFDTDVELDPELFKMELNELNPRQRRRLKTHLQDAEPTKFFGEEYLKLTKVINTLADIVDSAEEEELEGMDEENLKLIKKLAHLRKRYETLYEEIYGMVYGEEE